MLVELSATEIELLLASLEYARRAIKRDEGSLPAIRQEQVSSVDELVAKLQVFVVA
jgi:hypothetical protein